MRAELARKIVIAVSMLLTQAYLANCRGDKGIENLYGAASRALARLSFPLARKLDKEAMTTQMVEECWWG